MKWISRCLWGYVFCATAVSFSRTARSAPPMVEHPVNAASRPRAAAESSGRSVQLPYSLHDDQGRSWDISQDGSISSGGGGDELYDGGGHLLFDNGQAGYASAANVAEVTPRGDELIFPPTDYNGLKISRRVGVGAKGEWCRFVEIVQNPTTAPVKVRLQIDFELPNGVQASQPLNDDRQPSKPQLGIAVFGGHGAVAMIGAGRGSKVLPEFAPKPDEPSVEFSYTLDVPPRKTIAVVHLQIRRKTLDEAIGAYSASKEREFFSGLPVEIAKQVVNFPKAGGALDDIELLRGDLLDVVELRSGDQYKGTLKEPTWALQTAYGRVELPAERVVAMNTSGEHRPTQLLITSDGEIFAGILQNSGGATAPASGIRMQLSSGQVTQIPLASVSRVGYRRRDNEPEEWTFDKPTVSLSTGDRVKVELPSGDIPVTTRYGTIHLSGSMISEIDFQPPVHPVHDVTLSDGSRFAGLVSRDRFDLKPITVADGRTITLATQSISRLVCLHEPPKSDPDAPLLSLSNGDLLVGALDGKILLDTAFDSIEVASAEIRSMQHAERPPDATTVASPSELQITLWDNATLSGKLRGDTMNCRLRSGPVVAIPVSLLGNYNQPLPSPPASAVEKITRTVADLSDAQWQKRDRAVGQLIDLGPGIIGVLRDLRSAATGDGAKRLDEVLTSLEEARKAKIAAAPQPSGAQDGQVMEAQADDAEDDGVEANPPAEDQNQIPAGNVDPQN